MIDVEARALLLLGAQLATVTQALLEGGSRPRSAVETDALRTLGARAGRFLTVLNERLGTATKALSSSEGVAPEWTPAEDTAKALVLLVDDDLGVLSAMEAVLSEEYEVVATADPMEAMRLASERRPDALITDLRMPGLDGHSLLRMMRNSDVTADVPVLLVSAASETDEKLAAFDGGAFDYITKPVNLKELSARLRNAVNRGRELRRERFLQETDDLTGLANRRALRAFLGSALRASSQREQPLSVAMIDQDGLKQINDTYGHPAGDEAIRAVARALARCKRTGDCAARVGGDEFAMVMVGANPEGAARLLARVEDELRKNPVEVATGVHLPLRISFGIASLEGDADYESLLMRADQLLYEAKRRRKQELVSSPRWAG